LHPTILNILRLAAYQIIILERVPTYAAVDSAVDQARALNTTGVHKLVNAVLRSLDRSLAKDTLDANRDVVARALPLALGKWRHFDRDIFTDFAEDPGRYLSQVYSCPDWLTRQWWGRFDLAGASAVCLASLLRGPFTLRPNLLRTSSDELIAALANSAISSGPLAHAPGLWAGHIHPAKNELFLAGHFQPQGPTAMQVGSFTQIRPGQKVLDYCGGLGTKTTHLAELMNDDGLLVATDISPEKLSHAATNAQRLGITCIQFLNLDELADRFDPASFDIVLVDVPCSNTGVLASRPDTRWRIKPQHLAELVDKQKTILHRASAFVKPGGSLIYSTCSIEPVENDELTTQFSVIDQTLVFDADKEYLPRISENPADWRDGGYMARWHKK
jgi:16S rRNA (cytosine967-C5)-methyltransferase